MADTTYVDGATIFTADSANDFNRLHYTIFGDPAAAGPLVITLTSERARFTAQGYFKASNNGTYIGSTDAHHELGSNASGTYVAWVFNSHASAPLGLKVRFTGASPDDNTQIFLACEDTTTNRLIVYADGDVQNHDNSYGAISDRNFKQDEQDATSQWSDVKALASLMKKYRFKSDVAIGKDHVQLGLIAQDVLNVSPGLVTTHADEDGKPFYGLQYSVLYLKAVKALGEAMQRIEALEAA